jgi:thymidylate synthase ThyX
MKIEVIGSSKNLKEKEDFLKFSQNCGRVCYSEKDFEELMSEETNPALIKQMLNSGHHSVFEHINLTLYFKDMPKIFAMILNNEKQYATSEKSARYTKMSDIEPLQKEKYNKWMEILIPEINKVYLQMEDTKKRDIAIKKLAQENARYMTSVFTPTKMVYTLNLRQLNFLRGEFKKFGEQKSEFKKRLSKYTNEFLEQTEQFDIPNLRNQTDRHLSLFKSGTQEEHFGETYSISYPLSFAGLAQAHRHRTINYDIIDNIKTKGEPFGFFTPEIIKEGELVEEWEKDLMKISKNDFPQAQHIYVRERGLIENFRSKALLRLCGHAQHEIMKNTLKTANKYSKYQHNYKNSLTPKCQQGINCASPCVWGGKRALERII